MAPLATALALERAYSGQMSRFSSIHVLSFCYSRRFVRLVQLDLVA